LSTIIATLKTNSGHLHRLFVDLEVKSAKTSLHCIYTTSLYN